MMLQYKQFSHPADLCVWVNDNPKTITVHSVVTDEFGKLILFYSSSSNSEMSIPSFDADEVYRSMRKQETRMPR